MNNNTLLTLCLVLITMLSVKLHCTNEELNKQFAEVSQLENKFAILEADRLLTLDSVDVLNNTLEAERMALTNRLDGYKMKPTKERIKLITLIDTFAIPTDTGAILSLFGVDSINTLAISYQSCVIQSATKDTIITHYSNVISADSLIIASQQKFFKEHKKAAKIQLIKAAIFSGLVGLVIGLVI
jgi:hypothetical protein